MQSRAGRGDSSSTSKGKARGRLLIVHLAAYQPGRRRGYCANDRQLETEYTKRGKGSARGSPVSLRFAFAREGGDGWDRGRAPAGKSGGVGCLPGDRVSVKRSVFVKVLSLVVVQDEGKKGRQKHRWESAWEFPEIPKLFANFVKGVSSAIALIDRAQR